MGLKAFARHARCQTLTSNTKGRDFVVGDLHGCYDLLLTQLNALNFDTEKDRLISVGDLIDRGPKSVETLNLLQQKSWFYAVLGNHEWMALNANQDPEQWDLWQSNGGTWWQSVSPEEQQRVLTLMADLPLAIEWTSEGIKFGVMHAEVPNLVWGNIGTWDDGLCFEAIWSRELLRSGRGEAIRNVDRVFHGHTIISSPTMIANRYYIDTGAFMSGNLTIVQAR